MYIPTTFFSANGATIVSSGGTQGTFTSGSQLYGYNLFDTPGTASFTVFSGSVQNARLVIIGGGGGGMQGQDGVSFDLAAGGGGAGGVYIDNRIAIAPRTYQIVVGAGGNQGDVQVSPTVITPATNGGLSSFSYPLYSTIGFGGGFGGYAGQVAVGETPVRVFGGTGASGGGNAQFVNGTFINPSTATQGNSGGFISQSVLGTPTAFDATGGGGAGAGSEGITDAMADNGIGATAGGIGVEIPIYPINSNTASYFAGGGGAFGPGGSGASGGPNKVQPGGLGFDTYGGGGNAGGSGAGRNPQDGRGGLVYIEYPLYLPIGRYTFLRYDVDGSCNLTNATQVWSSTNYADGFYSIGGIQYRLEANIHTTYTIEITSAIPSFCPVRYTFLRYNVDGSCNLSNPTEVWSETNFSNGFYTIGGTLFRLEANTHTTYTTQITSATSSTCPPPFPLSGSLRVWNDTTSLTGSIWYDKSGFNNHGLVSGSTLSLSGSLGYAFNGTDNYVTYPITLNTTNPTDSYTLQYYGSLPSESTNRDFFTKEVYTNGWDTIYSPSTNAFIFRDQAGSDKGATFTPVLASKQLITITVNAGTDTCQLYVGPSFITNFGSGAVLNFNAASVPFRFGWNANADATFWKGGVSDILLYNKVLSATEVSQSFAYLSQY